MPDYIDVVTSGAVRVIRLTGSPSRGNPLNAPLWDRLLEAAHAADKDPAVRCIVLLGTERFFSVGADVREMVDRKAIEWTLEKWMDEWDSLRKLDTPIIAGVRGIAFGGGFELALLCDFMVVAGDARLALPETSLGVIPGCGGGPRLSALCGRAVALDMILTGRELSGREAVTLGVAARCHPADRVEAETLALAAKIAERSPEANRFAREVVREATEAPIQQALRIERLLAYLVFDTPERGDRMRAFLAARDSK